MPRLEQTSITDLPQGQIQADRFQQANPEDFGQETGQAIENAGAGVQSYGADEQEIASDKAQIWAIRAGADAAVATTQMATQMQQDPNFAKKYGEDGSGYAKAFEQNYSDYTDTVLGKAPNPETQRYLSQQLTEVGKTAMRDAIGYQASVGATWAKNNVQQTLDAFGRAAASNPQHYSEYLDQMQLAVQKTPYLSEQDRIELATSTKENMAEGAAMGWAKDNPEAALDTLRPQTLAQFKPTPRVESALANGQNVQLPNNTGGDTVKPYDVGKMQAVINQVNTPNAQLDPIFDKIGKAYGIDPKELKLRTAAESGLDPKAVGPMTSSGQAKGLAQLTDAKAKELGVTDPYDPGQAITAMAQIVSASMKTSGGDTSKTDMTYYGGNNSQAWGSNTKQYAENLNAVRMSLHGDTGSNPATFQDVLSMTAAGGAKQPVQEPGAPQFFNDLSWEKQYATIMQARQGVQFNQTRDIQLQTYANQQQQLAGRKFMSDSFSSLANKTLNPQSIIDNPNLSYGEKKNMMEGLHADLLGLAKDDPVKVNGMYEEMMLPVNDPQRISTEGQVWAEMAKGGLSVNSAKDMVKYMQDRQGPQGEVNNKMFDDFLKNGENVINPKNSFSLPDASKEQSTYYFKTAARMAIENGRANGLSTQDMLNPQSKNYIGGLINQFKGSGGTPNAGAINPYLNASGQIPNQNGTSPARPVISTQKDRDALPDNSYYFTPDGQTHYKAGK
jgi:hypothetical protein